MLSLPGRWSATYVGLLTGDVSKRSKRSFCEPLAASLAAATTAVSGLAQHPAPYVPAATATLARAWRASVDVR
jgi:hypothetical protein